MLAVSVCIWSSGGFEVSHLTRKGTRTPSAPVLKDVSCLLVFRNMEIIAVVKDSQNQQPIPTVWRATFSDIANSFVAGDYSLKSGISNVEPVQHDIAQQIQNYISEYGEVLISLQPDTWESSVCMWYKDHWEVLIDLCTVAEGLSDLVLKAKVSEVSSGFKYQVEMVYVP